jgi:predicted Zn-dependent protease
VEYTNPEIPEGINTSKEHPLKEFILLSGGVLAGIAALVLILILLSDFIVDYIPFSWEQQLSMPFTSTADTEKTRKPIEDYLQGLADRIADTQELPEGMSIKAHYLDNEDVNAFATLGGHVFFFRGLLEKLPHENALAMVMAHEIAHIKYRHPVRSLGRGVIVGLLMSVISSSIGDAIMQNFVNEAGILTVLKFNRDMEHESDEEAMKSLLSLYGHLQGADDLFAILQQESDNKEPFEFFSTHPLTEKRIRNIRTRAQQQPSTITTEVSPVPEAFATWLQAGKKADKPSAE